MSILDFILKAYELKELNRSGWVKKVGIKNPESVASHTYGMLLLALLFHDDPELFKSILVHDLGEVTIGDLIPEEKTEELKRKEYEAYFNLVSLLEKEKKEKFLSLYEKSKENNMLRELDKLDMAIQALYYKEKGYPKEKLEEFIISADSEIKNPKLKKIFEEVKIRFYS